MVKYFTAEKVSISTLDDIVGRSNFEASVSPRKSMFRYVIAAYSLPRKIASCSVNDCYQNHKKGYLIRYSKDQECCICESCAQRFMEPTALKPPKPTRSRASASTASGRTRSPAAPALTREISSEDFLAQSLLAKQRVKELKQQPKGANWLYKSLANFRQAYPAELFSALSSLNAEGENSPVYEQLIEVDASDQQLQAVEQLEGMAVFDGDIQQLLIEGILKPLKALDEKAGKAAGADIRIPVDWAENTERNFESAEKLLQQAQLFFTPENTERLKSIPLAGKAATQLATLHWDCDQGMVKKS